MGKIVRVHRNLHKKCWSVVGLHNHPTKVTHRQRLVIKNANMIVSEAGRRRVLDEQVKNVHAFIRGVIYQSVEFPTQLCKQITYNPYEFRGFFCLDDRYVKLLPVIAARAVLFDKNGKVYVLYPIYDLTGVGNGEFDHDHYPYFA
jgi:hypothetical protein